MFLFVCFEFATINLNHKEYSTSLLNEKIYNLLMNIEILLKISTLIKFEVHRMLSIIPDRLILNVSRVRFLSDNNPLFVN